MLFNGIIHYMFIYLGWCLIVYGNTTWNHSMTGLTVFPLNVRVLYMTIGNPSLNVFFFAFRRSCHYCAECQQEGYIFINTSHPDGLRTSWNSIDLGKTTKYAESENKRRNLKI